MVKVITTLIEIIIQALTRNNDLVLISPFDMACQT